MEMDYDGAIRSSVNYIKPNMRISRNAVKAISAKLSHLNMQLIKACFKYNRGKRKMSLSAASSAVNNIFKSDMRALAILAARKCVQKYNLGILKIQQVPRKKDKISSIKVQPEFTKGITPIAQLINPEMKIEKNAQMLLGMVLQEGCRVLVEKSCESSKVKNNMKDQDIIKAVDYYMAPTMAKHAICEGNRNAVMFHQGHTERKTEDFEVFHQKVKKSTNTKIPKTKQEPKDQSSLIKKMKNLFK